MLCFSSRNWLIIWICLEINTITFSFLLRHTNNLSEGIECGLKYFILQSRASACLLFCVLAFSEKTRKIKVGIPLLLLFKLGIIPVHTWFVLIGKKIKWPLLTTLITWQKTIPIYLITYSIKIPLLVRSILSIVFGTILQYKNNGRKTIIIYSSISNSCWIILSIILNIQLILSFCLIYFSSVFIIIKVIEKKQLNNSRKENELTLRFMLILTLAGIPPSLGFLPKWILFKEFVIRNISTIAFILFFFTAINFYVYLRLFTKTLTKKERVNIIKMKTNTAIKFTASFISIFGIVAIAIFC